MTVLLVTIGVIVRATDSGMGCPDWPLCHGQVIPPLDDPKAWIEWVHRTVAAVIGFMILGVAFLAWKDHRHQRSILIPSIAAVLLVGFQAWLGRETVRLNNSGESVTAHLAAAMALLGLLVFVTVRAFYPARIEGHGASQRFTLLAAFSPVATYALLLFGSHVTAQNAALVFLDWPLMNGTLVPIGAGTDAAVRPLYEAHALHRYVAIVVGLITWATAIAASRTQRAHPALVRLALLVAVLFPIQALIGGLQVLTQLAEWTQTLHLALGAVIWTLAAALAVAAYYEARTEPVPAQRMVGAGGTGSGGDEGETTPRTRGETVRAYIALTKPRIIELLLVTTVPAMVLATRDIPAMDLGEWLRLAFWTLLCGSLAAGSANAINQYLDRDIDLLMSRTRKRPLPAHSVSPENAVVFGIALGVLAIVLMAWFVNLVAAF